MNFNGTQVQDYNNFVPWNKINNPGNLPTQGLLVWVHKKKTSDPNWSYLMQADGENNSTTNFNTAPNDPDPGYHTGDSGDPFPGYQSNYVFSPWSFPFSKENGPSPTSYPSTNVGFEIVEMGADYIKVDLYYNSPEDATPQKPWNFAGTIYNNHPKITWDANSEPDLQHYEIWKKPNDGFPFSLYASTTNTYYVDTAEEIIGNDPKNQSTTPRYYQVRVKDTTSKTSLFTSSVKFDVSGPTIFFSNNSDNTELKISSFNIIQNYPNPFNPKTNITYNLPELSNVSLKVYNIQGKEISVLAEGLNEKGSYTFAFNGSALSSGIYIYKFTAKGLVSGKTYTALKRMLLIK